LFRLGTEPLGGPSISLQSAPWEPGTAWFSGVEPPSENIWTADERRFKQIESVRRALSRLNIRRLHRLRRFRLCPSTAPVPNMSADPLATFISVRRFELSADLLHGRGGNPLSRGALLSPKSI